MNTKTKRNRHKTKIKTKKYKKTKRKSFKFYFYKSKDNHLVVKIIFNKLHNDNCNLIIKDFKRKLLRVASSIKHHLLYNNIEKYNSANTWKQLYNICKNKTFAYCLKLEPINNIQKSCLYLCQSGISYREDARCKHAWLGIHSGIFGNKTNICCAGICVFQNNKLFMDNLSGTYKPSPQNLAKLQIFLQNQFKTKNINIILPSQSKKWCDIFINSPDYKSICK